MNLLYNLGKLEKLLLKYYPNFESSCESHYWFTTYGYFDYIEDLIERENTFTMAEFEQSVNAFLEFRQYKILRDNGKISHKDALEKAYAEYAAFNPTQPITSDFDEVVKQLINQEEGGD